MRTIWIVDASVALKWYIEEECHPNADAVLERILDEPGFFAVPELFSFEVYAVLQRIHPQPLETYKKGLLPVLNSGILRYPMTEALAENADRFVKSGLTGYDACYAALANETKGKWLTFDRKAHRKIQTENLSVLLDVSLPEGWF